MKQLLFTLALAFASLPIIAQTGPTQPRAVVRSEPVALGTEYISWTTGVSYAYDGSGQKDYVWRDGSLLASRQPDPILATITTYHDHFDHLGTPRHEQNGSSESTTTTPSAPRTHTRPMSRRSRV